MQWAQMLREQVSVGKSVGGQKYRWAKVSVGTSVGEHKCRWAQVSVGKNGGRHKCRVGTNFDSVQVSKGHKCQRTHNY